MAVFTATAAQDDHRFAGPGDDMLYFQFDAYANPGDRYDGGAGHDTIQIRSAMVAPPPDGGSGFVATDEIYDFTGIRFYSFERLSFYPMARMDMPGDLTFASDQFGTDAKGRALISNGLELVGSDFSSTDVQSVTVNLVAGDSGFDAAGWVFVTASIGTLPVRWTSGQDVIRLNGSAGDNLIRGSSQTDLIDGGAGRDTVSWADSHAAVTVVLAGSQGTWAEIAGGNRDWLINVENLIGSAVADRLVGDGGANLLDGQAGADRLIGGGGNDIYVVDRIGDRVVERAGGGTDCVQASISWQLGAHQERLTLTGDADLAATGNAQANRITGNTGDNRLTGGGGADLFVFTQAGFGADTITDFAEGDRIALDEALFASRETALAAARQVGGDVMIATPDPDSRVILLGVQLADLGVEDFRIL